jgi:hypothetical protein
VNTDSEIQGTITQNHSVTDRINPVVLTDAGFAVPAVAVLAVKPEICEETSTQMTESNIAQRNESKHCQLFCRFCGFWSRKE